jgi:predicted phage terminase large subunit-like protein
MSVDIPMELDRRPSDDISRATIYDYAAVDLFVFMALYNIEIDPQYVLNDKFFIGLCYEFRTFLKNKDERTFLLEAAPRTGKTDFIFKILLPFILGNTPDIKVLVLSATKQTLEAQSQNLKRTLESQFYKDVFPRYGKNSYNAKSFKLVNGSSVSFITSFSTVPTGSGFHFIFATDYISASWIGYENQLTRAYANWDNFMTRTQNNPPTKVIVDNQKLGFYDLSWRIMNGAKGQNVFVRRVTAPYKFQEDYKWVLGKMCIEFKKDEFLTSRFNEEEMKLLISKIGGEDKFRTQYLQYPVEDNKRILNVSYYSYYYQDDLKKIKIIDSFITTDLAFIRTTKSDYTVFMFWVKDTEENIYLVDMFRDKVFGMDLNQALYNFYIKCTRAIGGYGVNTLIIEQVTQNIQFIQSIYYGFHINDGNEIKKVSLNCQITMIGRRAKKSQRARACLSWIQAGKLFLPSYDVKIEGVSDVSKQILEPIFKETTEFNEDDTHAHDDIVDCIVDAASHAMGNAVYSDIKVETIK